MFTMACCPFANPVASTTKDPSGRIRRYDFCKPAAVCRSFIARKATPSA